MSQRLEGWKQIADYLNRSERWCRRAAARAVVSIRLPVWYLGGSPALTYEDADAWLARERDRTIVTRDTHGHERPKRSARG